MREALHPNKNLYITIEDYLQDFGRKPVMGTDRRPRARCPECKQQLNDVAGKSKHSIGHFAHFKSLVHCTKKTSAKIPFVGLTPRNPDTAHGIYLRTKFYEHREWHYSLMNDLVTYLSYQEFFALIKEANRLRIWEYRHLQEWELPYTLVLVNDFPSHTSYKKQGVPQRKYWVRFWYETSAANLEDLWIRGSNQSKLNRGAYKQPSNPNITPSFSDMSHILDITKEANFLNKPLPRLPQWLKDILEVELKLLLKI